MDNPFAKVSRPDLITIQVGLAKKLGIQLIPFTHNFEIEAFHHYENFIALKKHKTTRFNSVSIDQTKSLLIESSSVAEKPIIKSEQQELTSFLGEKM